MGCPAKECRALRYEEGYAISSDFPLLNSRYNSPGSQHTFKTTTKKHSFRCVPSIIPTYIRHSMHLSRDSTTAAEVIYMHQRTSRAAAAFRHTHVSPASQNKLQHGIPLGTLSNMPKGQVLCLQTLSQKGNCPTHLPWAPRARAYSLFASTGFSPEFRCYTHTHTEDYSWS